MKNILLKLTFDGSEYHGWQSQKNIDTVSGEIVKVIKKVTNEDVNLMGCSRTDAFVHALCYFANFKTDSKIPPEKFYVALNTYLPKNIRVLGSYLVSDDFHTRYDCTGKEYIYKLSNDEVLNPFYNNRVCHFKGIIDTEKLNQAAQNFVGTHDFKAFMSSGSAVKSTVRTIKYFNVKKQDDLILFSVYADGFLYNMVRIMVGTLLDIALGKISERDISNIINSKDRKIAGNTASPHGLYLSKTDYTDEKLGGSNVF